MGITTQNLLSHEWIGLKVTIERNPDPGTKGLTGRVIDETRNMFIIETTGRTLRIVKSRTVFHSELPTGETIEVDGKDLLYRPEDRIKKGLNRW